MSETKTAWREIAETPKDEDVLVHSPRWGTIIAQFSSEFDEWLSRMQVPVSLKGEDEQPTHWQPVPQAPEGAPSSD